MSFPSKVCLVVLSLQRVHIKHKGIDLQISSLVCFPKYPFQHDQWSTTEPGITQLSPKRLSPTVHISRAIEQWRNTYNTNPSELCHFSINYQLEFSPKLWFVKNAIPRQSFYPPYASLRSFPHHNTL